jgi:C-terminal processing protease CtpA/Prc
MKNIIFALYILTFSITGTAQNYDLEQLKVISTIWGETYLFNPSIIRADKNIEWEKQFVDLLPKIKKPLTTDEFIRIVNSHLLSVLEDPFTVVQNYEKEHIETANFKSTKTFDYLRITENQLLNIGSIEYLDSLVLDRKSNKALVVDLRINSELIMDRHSNTLFEYFASMLLSDEIELSSTITREHFGWDEYNDWWFYEQRWKVVIDDKQITNNGNLMPFKSYSQELYQFLPNYDFDKFIPIERPIYFITNNSFRSYYNSELISLQANRANTFIINEDSGRIFSANSNLRRYSFEDYEFILNTAYNLNHGVADLKFELNSASLDLAQIIKVVNSKHPDSIPNKKFSFNISSKKYLSLADTLSKEEKLLGVVKIWTIVNYFYPYPDQITVNWEKSLERYLELSQNTSSDKEYYMLIQEIMAKLNDSHVSTFHSSILDFSEIFVAPVQFDWIEDKVIVTAIDSSVKANINVGDEITAIDDFTINDILKKETERISSSNHQGLLATVINPGYFTGTLKSKIKFDIKTNGKQKTVEIPRTKYIFQFMGFGDNRQASNIFDNEIGYLNLAALTNSADLENELIKMKDTKSLILDLRKSYPTADYQKFLQMLCQSTVVTRKSEVPVISASHAKIWQYDKCTISPVSSFSYEKPIAVLIDKTMISRPEDVAIALKSFPNVLFVGEQTQGTDGEMTKIYLPGGGETSFTGQIVKFGNGERFQRIGIIPDIKVQRTIHGLKKNEDEILEKAIEVLNKN